MKRILIVEDDDITASTILDYLAMYGIISSPDDSLMNRTVIRCYSAHDVRALFEGPDAITVGDIGCVFLDHHLAKRTSGEEVVCLLTAPDSLILGMSTEYECQQHYIPQANFIGKLNEGDGIGRNAEQILAALQEETEVGVEMQDNRIH